MGNCHQNPSCQKFAKSRFDRVGHCPGRSDAALPTIAHWSIEQQAVERFAGGRQHPTAAVC
jgi:hypothetical protein